jgi:hypothetical protein
VSYALRIGDVHRFPTPGFLADSVVLSELMTFGTLLLEISLAIFVWNRTLRPWVLALGVSLHLSIEFTMMVGFFSLLMLTTYLAFLPPETARRLVLGVRERLRRGMAALRRAPASSAPSGGGRRGASRRPRAAPAPPPRPREPVRASVRGLSRLTARGRGDVGPQ